MYTLIMPTGSPAGVSGVEDIPQPASSAALATRWCKFPMLLLGPSPFPPEIIIGPAQMLVSRCGEIFWGRGIGKELGEQEQWYHDQSGSRSQEAGWFKLTCSQLLPVACASGGSTWVPVPRSNLYIISVQHTSRMVRLLHTFLAHIPPDWVQEMIITYDS